MGALFVLVVLLLPNGLASLPDLIRYQWAKASVKRNQAAEKSKAQVSKSVPIFNSRTLVSASTASSPSTG